MSVENKISGQQIELSEGRHVFHAEQDGYHYLRFRNSDAADTKLKLSADAVDALIELLTAPREVAKWVLRCADGEQRDAITWERVE